MKRPGEARKFYDNSIDQPLRICCDAIQLIRDNARHELRFNLELIRDGERALPMRFHSRAWRAFDEPPLR